MHIKFLDMKCITLYCLRFNLKTDDYFLRDILVVNKTIYTREKTTMTPGENITNIQNFIFN